MNNKINIHLASPRGFCAGVDRAIEIVKKTIKKYGSPVYVRHEIVHNKYVVEDLKKQGVIFVEELDEVKDKNRPVIFSAHGVPKNVPETAKLKKIFFIDATCPLVSKVHREAEQLYKNNFQILLIGHANHPEVIGTMGQLPKNSVYLIENKNDALLYENKEKREAVAELCYQRAIEEQFNWDTIASQFGGVFEDALKEVNHSIVKPKPKLKRKPRRPKPKREIGKNVQAD